MRILITGATGFIGRHLLERLTPEHEIYALVRRLPPAAAPAVRYVIQDLARPLEEGQLPSALDAIIHQAALIDTDGVAEALPFLVNVVGTWRLLTYAAEAGVKTFVHASTGGIYGCCHHPLQETDPPNPMDLYSLTKAQAELAVKSAPGGFQRMVLRYFFPYGVGTPNPIPIYVRNAVAGRPNRVLQGGGPRFNPLHIADAVEATVRVLALQGDHILNVAGGETTTFGEIARIAARRAGREPVFSVIPDHEAIPYYRSDLVADTRRMASLLGFTPRVTLVEGLEEMARHYLPH